MLFTQVAVTRIPTPLFNTSDLSTLYARADGKLPLDNQLLLRPIETILFPGTKCHLLERFSEYVYSIETNEYPGGPYYVDSRFLKESSEATTERRKTLPPLVKVVEMLKELAGTPYIWGGNWSFGIPEMLAYYPPKVSLSKLDPLTKRTWTLSGVDCSGLIYQVTNGFTPRNTSQLVFFGKSVPIQGKTIESISSLLKPLDAIVWKGHVIFMLEENHVIESLGTKGVIITSVHQRLNEITTSLKKTPCDEWNGAQNSFVVRRWHPESI